MRKALVAILVAMALPVAGTAGAGSTHAAAGSNATATPAARSGNDTVAVIGDSLTYQGGTGRALISDQIGRSGHGGGGIYFWAVGGKRLTEPDSAGMTTMDNIRAARSQLGHVDLWVMALGTNNRVDDPAVVRRDVDTVLTALRGDRFVWIGLGFYEWRHRVAIRMNSILTEAVATKADGTVAAWDDWIHDPVRASEANWTYPRDLIHMTSQGYVLRNEFYGRMVDSFSR
jgi:hypothetical protein